jgi:uncharacterized membrane protein (DUF485 family)
MVAGETQDVAAQREALAREADALVRERLTFALPFAFAGLMGFLLITGLAGFTHVLDRQVFGPISLLCALLLILLPLCGAVAWAYGRRARDWDRRSADARGASDRELSL